MTAHNTIVLISNTVSIVVHVTLCHLFTVVMGLPVATVAAAFGISCLSNLMILALYSKFCIEHKVSMFGMFSMKLLEWDKVNEYMAISIPSIVMLCAEWWAMEILSMLAILLGTIEIAAMTISYNYIFIQFNVPDGFQIGTVALMGQAIGEENQKLAKLLSVMGLGMSMIASAG